MSAVENSKSLGIVGGLVSMASDDLFFKRVKSTTTEGDTGYLKVIIETESL